jgi:hypothetical protein
VHLLVYKARTNEGRDYSERSSWFEVQAALLDVNIVNTRDADRWTPLHFALEYRWTEPKGRVLAELVADVNLEDTKVTVLGTQLAFSTQAPDSGDTSSLKLVAQVKI